MDSVVSQQTHSRIRSWGGRLVILAMIAIALISTLGRDATTNAAQVATPTIPLIGSPEPTTAETAEPAPTGAGEVTVGVYLTSIYGLDQQASTFYADYYLWLRWRGDTDPTLTLELQNNVERWGLIMTPIYEVPTVLASGENLQIYQVQGEFFQPLTLNDYPLDQHGLSIVFEDSTFQVGEQTYVADVANSGIAPDLRIPGWNVKGWAMSTPSHRYETNFGDESVPSQEYSTLRFTLDIERPTSFFTWKLLMPLVIVLLLGCSVLLVHPSLTEVRLAGPATALLTLVFLQQGYTTSLPDNGSLVMLDKVYVLAYALVICILIVTIVTSYWLHVDEQNASRAIRLDRAAAGLFFGLFVVGTVIFVLPLL